MKRRLSSIHESDQIYLDFGADKNVYGVDKEKEIREIRRRAINANLKTDRMSNPPSRNRGGIQDLQPPRGSLKKRSAWR